jgi:hypothetical protein
MSDLKSETARATKIIQDLRAGDSPEPVSYLRTALSFSKIKLTGKEVNALFEKLGIDATAKKPFVDTFYEWLIPTSRSIMEVKAYVMGDGEYGETSDNVQNHLTHYAKIGKTLRTVHSDYAAAKAKEDAERAEALKNASSNKKKK